MIMYLRKVYVNKYFLGDVEYGKGNKLLVSRLVNKSYLSNN